MVKITEHNIYHLNIQVYVMTHGQEVHSCCCVAVSPSVQRTAPILNTGTLSPSKNRSPSPPHLSPGIHLSTCCLYLTTLSINF